MVGRVIGKRGALGCDHPQSTEDVERSGRSDRRKAALVIEEFAADCPSAECRQAPAG